MTNRPLLTRLFVGILTILSCASRGQATVNVNLQWSASTTDTDGTALTDLAGYRIYSATYSFKIGGVFISTPQAAADPNIAKTWIAAPATSFTATLAPNVTSGTTFYFRGTVLDLPGNQSAFNLDASGNDVEVSTFLPPPPVAPAFSAVIPGPTSIQWNWTLSPYATGYRVLDLSNNNISGDLAASQLSWVETKLSTNTQHARKIEAFNVSGSSDSVAVSSYTLADSPINSAAVALSSYAITFSWGPNTNPAGTNFEVSYSSDGSFAKPWIITTLANQQSPLTPNKLMASTVYYFRVRAINGDNAPSAYDATVSAQTLPPAAVVLSASALSPTSIQWSWTASANAVGYNVLDASNGSILQTVSAAPNPSWIETGLSANVQYSRQVAAFDASGASTSTAAAIYTLANAPSNSKAVALSSYAITLSWSPNANPAGTNFEVSVSSVDAFASSWAVRTLPPTTQNSLTLNALRDDTTYYFHVRAFNGGNIPSAFDSAVSTKTWISTYTWVGLVWDPVMPSQVILAVESNDWAFPNSASLAPAITMPSGTQSFSSMQQISASPLRYAEKLPASNFTSADFSGNGAAVTVTAGGRSFIAALRVGELDPSIGGRITEPAGLAQVVIAPGGVTQEAQITINQAPPDVGNVRGSASQRQGMPTLDPGRDIIMSSSGTLNAAILTLPFDPTLIPQGLTVNQVRVAYFNFNTGNWELIDNATVVGNTVQAQVKHFSLYAPVILRPDSTSGLRDAYVYPNPAVRTAPTMRALLGVVNSVEITIFDVSGRQVHSATLSGAPTGIYQGQYYYDYTWNDRVSSGIYFVVFHGKSVDGSTIKARSKFAVIE